MDGLQDGHECRDFVFNVIEDLYWFLQVFWRYHLFVVLLRVGFDERASDVLQFLGIPIGGRDGTRLGVFKVLIELQENVEITSSEAIDGLPIVPNGEEAGVSLLDKAF